MTEFTFNVPMPEAGEGAIATFTTRDFEALCDELEADGILPIMVRVEGLDIKSIRAAAKVGIKGGDAQRAEDVMALEHLAERLFDAMIRRVKGKTLAELNAPPAE